MIDIPEKDLETVKGILRQLVPDCEVRAFGSRTNGNARKFSDLDLVLIAGSKIDDQRLAALKSAFSASDLPLLVDIIDWNAVSDAFRTIIQNEWQILQKAGT